MATETHECPLPLESHAQRSRIEQLTLIADPQVARKLNICLRTLDRWEKREGFPRAIVIANRKYRRLSELEDWLYRRALASVDADLDPVSLRKSRASKASRKTV